LLCDLPEIWANFDDFITLAVSAKGDLNEVAPVSSKLEIYLKRITVQTWPIANRFGKECPSSSPLPVTAFSISLKPE